MTHAHPDHSGGASYYKNKYQIQIAGPKKLNNWYTGFGGILSYFIDIILNYMVASKKGIKFKNLFFPRKIKLDIELEHNEKVPGFHDWIILEAPGHTASDISIYHPKSSTAYIADNIISSKTSFYRPYPLHYPQKYKTSLQQYIDLNIASFLLAHHGENKISHEVISDLIQKTPRVARAHKNTLHKILGHLFKS